MLSFLLFSCSGNNETDIDELMACGERGAPVEFISVTEKPKFSNGKVRKENAALYTEMAQRAQIEGTVRISFQITESGKSEDVFIEKKIGGGADESSLRAIQDSQFIPANFKTKPLCVKASAQAIFDLDNPENVVIYLVDVTTDD